MIGSGLLIMLRNFVGHNNFRNAIITYMERLLVTSIRITYFFSFSSIVSRMHQSYTYNFI
jgi:hypothetical protein